MFQNIQGLDGVGAMPWACMATSGSLIVIDDVNWDKFNHAVRQ